VFILRAGGLLIYVKLRVIFYIISSIVRELLCLIMSVLMKVFRFWTYLVWQRAIYWYSASSSVPVIMLVIIMVILITRLPSNLRPTTCECVHLVTRGHFQLHDKDGGHTIQSAIAENPILHQNIMALCFIQVESGAIEAYIVEEGIFIFFLLRPWPWPDDLHIRTWPVFPGDTPDAVA